ncbi:MAG: tetratricopeptide repeat protein [Sneathiella sp.]
MLEYLTLKRIVKPSTLLIAGLVVGCASGAVETIENPSTLYQNGEFFRAAEIWEQQAQAGDPSAQFNLSTIYQTGRGVDRDLAISRRWLNRAALNNYAPALHNLALIEIEKNQFKSAKTLLEKAVKQDFAASLYTLGKFHQEGIIGDVKPELAAYYVRKAANSGLDKAQYNLGKMYRDGFGVEQDDVQSFFWFLKAAKQGSRKAQVKVAKRFAKGLGAPKDNVKALTWVFISIGSGSEALFETKTKLLKILSDAEIKAAKAEALILEEKFQK